MKATIIVLILFIIPGFVAPGVPFLHPLLNDNYAFKFTATGSINNKAYTSKVMSIEDDEI